MVERETQKGIIIGHKGSALKRVGIGARKTLESFFWKKNSFGIVCKGFQKLAIRFKAVKAIWIQ